MYAGDLHSLRRKHAPSSGAGTQGHADSTGERRSQRSFSGISLAGFLRDIARERRRSAHRDRSVYRCEEKKRLQTEGIRVEKGREIKYDKLPAVKGTFV